MDQPVTTPSGLRSQTAATPDAATPAYLTPTMGEVELSEPVYYRSLFMLDSVVDETGELKELDKPLDPFVEPESAQAPPRPAYGLMTVHEQAWFQKGLALGNLIQSVCLAPGEVTQVAVTRWERKTLGGSQETTQQEEDVSSGIEQNRAVNEVQRAVAHEAQNGGSSVTSSSSSAQAGGGFFWASASGSTTKSSAMTAQFSAGSRDLAVDSTSAIAQATAEKSHGLRSRRQSVVREVSEQQAETMSTRILANYNRRHSLNILFFEVLQTYEFATKLASWDRCLFLPLVPIDFSKVGEVEKHQAELLSILADTGATDLIPLLNRAIEEDKATPRPLTPLPPGQGDAAAPTLDRARQLAQEYTSCKVQIDEAKSTLDDLARSRQIDLKRHFQKDLKQQMERDRMQAGGEATVARNTQRMTEITALWAALSDQLGGLPGIDTPPMAMRVAINALAVTRASARIPARALLDKHRMFLNQQLWLRLSPYRIHRLLRGYKIADQSLSALIDPQPIGVFGNYLAFRWGFSENEAEKKAQFKATYMRSPAETLSHTVGLPTSGVFSEAVLGQGLAAEQIDTRFARWGDKEERIPILPPKMAPLQSRDRATTLDFSAQGFSPSLAQLRSEKLDDVSHIDKILAQVGRGDMFRDMGGLAQASSLAEKMASLSAAGATAAGDRVEKLQEKVLDTFEKLMDGDVGKAAVAEFMLPGSGASMLTKGAGGKSAPPEGPPAADPHAATPAAAPAATPAPAAQHAA